MTRRGKIARLPHSIREEISQRLHNGDEAGKIAAWLNELPAVRAVTDAEFGGEPVSQSNLSKWKLGGYREWVALREATVALRQSGADAAELGRAGDGALTDQLALCLAARLAVAWQESGAGADLQPLRELCADIVALRKGDHEAQWLRIEREKMERKVNSS